MHPEQVTPPRLRTSDSEREQIAGLLREAMTEGRLTLDEGEQRLGAAYAATFRDDLDVLVRDLPRGDRGTGATRRSMQRHLRLVVIAAGLLVALWTLSGATFFWPVFPLFFLLTGLFRHARWHRHGVPARPRF
ncbi:hypothetical protein ACWT_1830 [Actinoplanes sp. SE50]|uniref:DUF1707 domain-containing protein n=1 Tax=unclassified Actinoplanes TaxID=2626549 RepID=UPI00023ED5A3|nr:MULTISPECIES: DUF1707 domain-containing protein [unclassified Actinoplanes]AEV82849.1 uncharacterized protein ACPL_1952 [Actinoplanes sp. SE50/110]ATO81245.1 hypothetical protein ACWT_1830 [Actinoplanes sp. SE50]SLL98652.1 hypothetical protein ACSP50_1879 [Actinoplanes sp. SE50/110]